MIADRDETYREDVRIERARRDFGEANADAFFLRVMPGGTSREIALDQSARCLNEKKS